MRATIWPVQVSQASKEREKSSRGLTAQTCALDSIDLEPRQVDLTLVCLTTKCCCQKRTSEQERKFSLGLSKSHSALVVVVVVGRWPQPTHFCQAHFGPTTSAANSALYLFFFLFSLSFRFFFCRPTSSARS